MAVRVELGDLFFFVVVVVGKDLSPGLPALTTKRKGEKVVACSYIALY